MPKPHRIIERLALSIGLLSTLGMMIYASHAQLSIAAIAFMVWATLPFVLIYKMVSRRLRIDGDHAISKPASANAIIMTLSTSSIYYTAIFRSQDATTAMIFLCWPVWLAVGTPVIFGLLLRIFRYTPKPAITAK
ncbi:hypothetical protein JYU10_00040 [bacterium AH-315-J04]|nr:hypothetical protein [bacterium AH-315-J04]